MNNKSSTIKKINSQILLLLLISERSSNADYDVYFFLIKYSFLFSNNDKIKKSCNLKTTHFLIPQENGENGARYLDPKYSRWLSTDPALGEYVTPDKEKKYGVFDFINLNVYHYGHNNPITYTDPDGRADDYFISKTYETYEIAITEVKKYIRENYKGNEFAGLIEVNNKGHYFFKIKEGQRDHTKWGYTLMESNDELQYIISDFHSHPSRMQELKDDIKKDYPNSTIIQIKLEFGYRTMRGNKSCGFFYVGEFKDEKTIWTMCLSSAISQDDINNSRKYPNKPSLIFSSDFEEYCIIKNGQIINPTNN